MDIHIEIEKHMTARVIDELGHADGIIDSPDRQERFATLPRASFN